MADNLCYRSRDVTLSHLVYVSISRLETQATTRALEALVSEAAARNRAHGITGALLLAGGRFLQYLEGPQPNLLRLMQAIRRDPRHEDVQILRFGESASRRFPAWSLAYAGNSPTAQRVLTLAADDGAAHGRDWSDDLVGLLEDCADFQSIDVPAKPGLSKFVRGRLT
ncbi:BLUF domain-containing protein [Phenylobacterium sp. J426]|uniref:BLUF domain-containing protein n=1 Tax=Phenylobacterium sp. J426 TaxID=2898439 RepID=UPI0035B2AB52